MRISQRAISGENDLRAMEALALDFRADNLHVADLPWRFSSWSSWALDDPQNVRLWTDADGRLLAWAVL